MNFTLDQQQRQNIALISMTAILIGIFFSRALMSIGSIAIFLLFFTTDNIKLSWKNFLQQRYLVILTFLFFTYVLSGLVSEDLKYYLSRITLKLPLTALPIGFSVLYPFPDKYIRIVIWIFLLLLGLTSLLTLINYIKNYDQITYLYRYAQVMPVSFGVNHIRYSLMMALSIWLCIYLLFVNKEKLFKGENYFIIALGLFHLIFIHIFSVRSGLLALYSTGILFGIYDTIKNKRIIQGAILLLSAILFPILVYNFVPTIKNKIDYMVEDVGRFMKGESANNYSDSNRLLSMKIGIQLGLEHPILGVGAGDIKTEMDNVYKNQYSDMEEKNRLIPHNQFVYTFAATGIIGLIALLIAYIYPFLFKNTYEDLGLLSSLCILSSSFISESTLEIQLGIILFLLFILLNYKPQNLSIKKSE